MELVSDYIIKENIDALSKESRNIDEFKVILSILVIMLHSFNSIFINSGIKNSLPYCLVANGLARIAVPIFYIITGYLLRKKIDTFAYVKKYVTNNIYIYIVWMTIYFVFYFNQSPLKIVYTLIFGYWHLWYLSALICGVICLHFVKKFFKARQAIFIAIILYYTGYFFQLYMSIGRDIPYEVILVYKGMGTSRNFIFMALPFLILGQEADSLKTFFVTIKSRSFIFGIILIIESGVVYVFICKNMDFYISILPISLFIFLLFKEKKKEWLSRIKKQRQLSLYIFLTHIIFINLLFKYSNLNPLHIFIVTIILSVAFSYLIIFCNEKLILNKWIT